MKHSNIFEPMMGSQLRRALSAILLALSFLLGGCTHKPKERAEVFRPVPLRIVILQDRSGSVDSTRTPRISMDQFGLLIASIEKRGGSIAFGFIDDDSNKPFTVLRVDSPPSAPLEPSKDGNPFKVEEALAKYKKDRAAFEAQERQWREDTNKHIEAFKSSVARMIEDKHKSRSTDIFGGLRRADLYLAESGDTYSSGISPLGYMVVISDGLDNVRRPIGELRSHAHILLINASASVGVISAYSPERFESIDSAFLYITREEPKIAASESGSIALR